jgi:hypothetical protein
MTTPSIRTSLLALCAAGVCTLASAKLPAPSPEAAAKAAEAAAKTAWAGKVDNYKLCLSQDKVAAHYRKTTPSAKPAVAGAACADPGPFAYTPPAAKPAEAAGAHSPPGTASSPPSTQVPAAAATPASKS